jgi:hypothetical protein
MDALDEFYYSNRTLKPEELANRKFASSPEAAGRFINLYRENPDLALISIICDHYRLLSSISDNRVTVRIPEAGKEEFILKYIRKKREATKRFLGRCHHISASKRGRDKREKKLAEQEPVITPLSQLTNQTVIAI